MSTPLLLPDSLAHAARLWPERAAVTDGRATLTYGALWERAARLAAALRGPLAQVPGARFALLARNRVEIAEVYFGGALAGCACVPVNYRLAAPEVAAILADAAVEAVFVDEDLEDLLPEGGRRIRFGPEYDALLERATPTSGARPDAAATVLQIYTSGTTGTPKGVMLSHRNLVANSWTNLAERNVVDGDTYLVTTPLCQIGGVSRLLTAVHAAATVDVRPRFDAGEVLALIESGGVTTAFLVPTMIRDLLDAAGGRALDTSRFRRLCYGGSPTPLELLQEVMERMRCELQQGYGLTESSPNLTTLRPEDHVAEGPAEVRARLGSVGRESTGVQVRVVDEAGREVAAGERGEIVARGPNVMEGYWRRPEATAEAIRDGWLHTGDVGLTDDGGYLFIVDRLRDLVISGGINVYPREVELVLEADPEVAEVAVTGRPDARWGEVLVAFVVPRPGAAAEALRARLEAACANRLAHFKAPHDYVFVDRLPRNAMGKVLKRELRAQGSAGGG